ncbi:ribonuclease Z [Thermosporothrix hazakensis]|jgi:ribonuclease Z|uniref:Ribonuclease Z n=2 Tax=Thermosporothrix TaxID=768650 RepID=A0A326UBA4_THEHA|nr:ribonuclease Z [Thermosporothrix hazakensis]PZW32869.1 ribonuclease Z [Thermosporothrix hazakensis]BBH90850.1 ribonuclease Z [Thermosporothrix sp. COM3]GCE48901.1 ribonuclease Z [Thermosporothrix hazakensis]
MLDICLLGTCGMMPLPGRWLSSTLVRFGSTLTLFDCGEGTQIPWKSLGWGFRQLGAICFSHMHADHVAGLPGILFMLAHAGKTDPLDIYGPTGTTYIIDGLRRLAPELPFPIHIHELRGEQHFELPGGLKASCIDAVHGVPCLAYRVELERKPVFEVEKAKSLGLPVQYWKPLQQGEVIEYEGQTFRPEQVLGAPRRGISFAIITDSRPAESLSQFAHDVDLLICESMYDTIEDLPLAKANAHMVANEAAGLAKAAHARQLVLTHFSPKVQNTSQAEKLARSVFPNTRTGKDGMIITLNYTS